MNSDIERLKEHIEERLTRLTLGQSGYQRSMELKGLLMWIDDNVEEQPCPTKNE